MLHGKAQFWLFLLPGFLGLTVFYIAPFLMGIYFTLINDGYPRVFIGAANLVKTVQNEMFRLAMRNTSFFSVWGSAVLVIFSFALACLFAQYPNTAKLNTPMLMSYVLPSVSIIMIFRLLFGYGGPINHIAYGIMGKRYNFLYSDALRIPVMVLYCWRNLGFFSMIPLSAIQSLPADYYDYARLEGASFWKTHTRISLPLIAPTLVFVLLLAFTGSLKIFKEIYALGGNYPSSSVYTLQHYMNNQFIKMNYSALTSAAYMFAALVIGIFAALMYLENRYRNAI